MEYVECLDEINIGIYFMRLICITLITYYSVLRNIEKTVQINKNIKSIIAIIIIAIICEMVRHISNFINSMMLLILLMALIIARNKGSSNIGYYILMTIIFVSINYVLFFFAVVISYIPNYILKIQNNYISFLIIIIIYFLLSYMFSKIKKFKHGFSFLKNKISNEYFDVLILNISSIILFSILILSNYSIEIGRTFGIALIIFAIIMYITIQKSIQIYYKQKLLIKDLNETKEELKRKNEEIEELEKENLNISKKSHTIAHKQKVLEYKLNELAQKNEIAEELEIASKINEISKQISKKETVTIVKTQIPEIDNTLKYMQAESKKNGIDLQVQINGNLYHMTNNYINKEDLATLLADHIKNAIIAVNHIETTNNKSILVRLGLIDGIYSLYIYDSGIEFELETLSNLGKKPSTTHKEEGGTGLGFMNTFDTLNKYKASLEIKEIGKPINDEYTKILMIKFDEKSDFKIDSYRAEKIENKRQKI